ncbi:MAG: hypothetical protein HOV97_05670 [Nonomuraea sp.]|nr:hypothetical protein [Nonomuraea sp.]
MTLIDDWNKQHVQTYLQQYEMGLHDIDCEQRERSYICHCSKRKREAEGKTTLPQIYFTMPICDGCNKEVDHDGDNFFCPRCKVAWVGHTGDGDQADHFIDDYGTEDFGGEQFGERLIALAVREGNG